MTSRRGSLVRLNFLSAKILTKQLELKTPENWIISRGKGDEEAFVSFNQGLNCRINCFKNRHKSWWHKTVRWQKKSCVPNSIGTYHMIFFIQKGLQGVMFLISKLTLNNELIWTNEMLLINQSSEIYICVKNPKLELFSFSISRLYCALIRKIPVPMVAVSSMYLRQYRIYQKCPHLQFFIRLSVVSHIQ